MTFDALLRRVARQTTRRAALATLLGGALLLNDPAASEATKEAERRKKRRRRHKSHASSLKPIEVWIDNTGGDRPAKVEHGYWRSSDSGCCTYLNTASVPAGERRRFASPTTAAYVWIDDMFWFSFDNPVLERPDVSAAWNGMATEHRCCLPVGRSVFNRRGMSPGDIFSFMMNGQTFTVSRNRDTNYKSFTVFLPAIQ